MSLLTAGELALMRQDSNAALPQTMNVLRLTAASDARGGHGQVYALAQRSVPCRLAPNSTRTEAEREAAERLGVISPWIITTAWDADILMTDRLVIQGMTLEVVFTDALRADLIAKRIMAKQVD